MANGGAFHRPNALLTSEAALARLGEVGRRDDRDGVGALNDLLETSGRGRPVYGGELLPSGRVMLPVEGYVPGALDAIREQFGTDLGPLLLDFQVDPGFQVASWDALAYSHYVANGCRTGHAWGSWEFVDEAPPIQDWQSGLADRPVVALLDNGVVPHPALDTDPADPFLLDGPRWQSPLAGGRSESGSYGSHYGHGTFIAGLIRQFAPDAAVLPIKVIDDDGRGYESDVIEALQWLSGRIAAGQRVDVACLPFGRYPYDENDEAPILTKALDALRTQGVQLVASAGNDGGEVKNFPAAVPGVIAVKALNDDESVAPYSSDGEWVTAAEHGTQISTFPLDEKLVVRANRFVRWSGTSFAAGFHAAKLAASVSVAQVP